MPKVELRITLEEDGKINVHGPIVDQILCLGLLRIAEQIVLSYRPPPKKEEPSLIIPDRV